MRPPLPIDDALPTLRAALAKRGLAVLQAPPGAGKTTAVPLDLLQAGLFPGRIVMLEPRRLAATPLAPPRVGAVSRGVVITTLATAVIGLLLGMTLFLYALQGTETGIIATLSATSPVIILPLLWLRTGQRPTATSWAGALLAVAGLALIFTR